MGMLLLKDQIGRARGRMRILEVGPRVPKCWGLVFGPPSLKWSGTELCLPRGRGAFSYSHGNS